MWRVGDVRLSPCRSRSAISAPTRVLSCPAHCVYSVQSPRVRRRFRMWKYSTERTSCSVSLKTFVPPTFSPSSITSHLEDFCLPGLTLSETRLPVSSSISLLQLHCNVLRRLNENFFDIRLICLNKTNHELEIYLTHTVYYFDIFFKLFK